MNNLAVLYIVDDDPDDQYFLIEAMKEIDPSVQCYTAINGQEGLQKLHSQVIPLPSLIILDLNMPKINGRQFLKALHDHAAFTQIPVIVYSTSSNQNDVSDMKQLGANDYLVKQPDYPVLKEQLQEILSRLQFA